MSNKLEDPDPLRPFNPEELSIGQIQQKHFAEANGMLFPKVPDEQCHCGHFNSVHLDAVDICLSKNCWCDSFRNRPTTTSSTYEDQSKIIGKRKKQRVDKARVKETNDIPIEDRHIFDYIRQMSKM